MRRSHVPNMTKSQREAYLAEVHIGVLSVGRTDKAPLTVPTWYTFRDGLIFFTSGGDARKTKLLREAGRASLCVHNDSRPYWYVTAEGPVRLLSRTNQDVEDMASRYLGAEAAREYAKKVTWEGVLVELTPEEWLTLDYSQS
jgi:nitroimidazol reductase NimA-like FMN-containing flavoprotein (pyridoxamine 5'-phosphate oxidase superfamily)